MRREHQLSILRRLAASGERHVGLHGDASRTQSAGTYADPDRFVAEQRTLFGTGPVFVGLSCEIPSAGDHLTATFDSVPILVVRQDDGSIRAMVNICRHRGAPLADGPGSSRRIVCGYHAWSYGLDGALINRPLTDGAFDDVDHGCDLIPLVAAEAHGLMFVRPRGDEPIDVDRYLDTAVDDLDALHLPACVLVEQRTNEWAMNWKLLLDTFGEAYHIRTLHQTTLAPYFDSGCTIFEPYGPHMVNIGFRKKLDAELAKPEAEQRLLPFATMQFFLLPNALVVFQVDHLEVWRVEPVAVDRCRATTSVFAMSGPVDDDQRAYLVKNLDLLLDVTGREDFPMMEAIQANLASGAVPDVVFGKIEPALVHFHERLDAALAAGGIEALVDR